MWKLVQFVLYYAIIKYYPRITRIQRIEHRFLFVINELILYDSKNYLPKLSTVYNYRLSKYFFSKLKNAFPIFAITSEAIND